LLRILTIEEVSPPVSGAKLGVAATAVAKIARPSVEYIMMINVETDGNLWTWNSW